MPIPITFDTSVLRSIRVDKPSAEYKLLQHLADSNKIQLLVPEMAAREWLSHLTKTCYDRLDELNAASNRLLKHQSLQGHPIIDGISNLNTCQSEANPTAKEHVLTWYKRKIMLLNLTSLAINPADLQSIIDNYFKGEPPFSSEKSRSDFPDAFVLAGVIRCYQDNPDTIFVCQDKNLSKAAINVGIQTVSSLPSLLRTDSIASLHRNTEFALKWETYYQEVAKSLIEQQESLSEIITGHVSNIICDHLINDPSIPEDNNEASVSSANVYKIEFDFKSAESYGEGLLSVPIEVEAELELEFYVFRSEAYEVPFWVSVSIGDFEKDHYFDAYGYQNGRFTGRLVLGFDDNIDAADIDLPTLDISIEDLDFEELL